MHVLVRAGLAMAVLTLAVVAAPSLARPSAAHAQARELATPDVTPPDAYSARDEDGDEDLPRAPDVASSGISEGDAERLDLVLREHSDGARGSREVGGWLGLVSGILIAGGGGILMGVAADGPTLDPLLFVGGGLAASLAVGAIASSIVSLLTPSAPERRYMRFVDLRDRRRLDARALGGFEGELQSDAEASYDARLFSLAGAFALVVSGAVALGYTAAFGFSDEFRIAGYSVGGLYMGLGIVQIVTALLPSAAEERWRAYQQTLSITPVVGPTAVGVAASGSF